MVETILVRNSSHIDPVLSIWNWEIPVYLFLGGMTAGIMIIATLMALRDGEQTTRSRWVRWSPFVAPILISLGMLALLMDLSYKPHVFRFYTAFRPSSPMSWGAWLLVGIYPATILLGLSWLKKDEVDWLAKFKPIALLRLGRLLRWFIDFAGRWQKPVLWMNLVFGIGMGIYTGILLSALGAARPAWNSALLGPLFLVSGFSTGAALLMLFPLNHKEHGLLRRWDMGAVMLELSLLALFLLGLASSSQQSRGAAELFLGGPYTALFWTLVVVVGLAVPLGIEAIESFKKHSPTRLAPVLLLVGGLSLRWILVAAGQS